MGASAPPNCLQVAGGSGKDGREILRAQSGLHGISTVDVDVQSVEAPRDIRRVPEMPAEAVLLPMAGRIDGVTHLQQMSWLDSEGLQIPFPVRATVDLNEPCRDEVPCRFSPSLGPPPPWYRIPGW